MTQYLRLIDAIHKAIIRATNLSLAIRNDTMEELAKNLRHVHVGITTCLSIRTRLS